jgi:hypothetical protein
MRAHMLFSRSLRDLPCPSFILSRYICCLSWKGSEISSMLVNLWGRHVVLLSVISSTWQIHVNVLITDGPCCWSSSRNCNARPSYYNDSSTYALSARPSDCPIHVYDDRLRPCHVVNMAVKNPLVSHTSSRMVWTCSWCSPSTGLCPPPQLTSNCTGNSLMWVT